MIETVLLVALLFVVFAGLLFLATALAADRRKLTLRLSPLLAPSFVFVFIAILFEILHLTGLIPQKNVIFSVFYAAALVGVLVFIASSISLRKELLQAFRTQSWFKDFSENISDWVWNVDCNGVITYSNHLSTKIINVEPAKLIGKVIFDFMSPEDSTRCRTVFEELKASGETSHNIMLRLQSETGPRDISVSCVPIKDNADRLEGFHGVARDMTEVLRLERSEREALRSYQTIFENSLTGILIIQNEKIINANPAIERLMGYSIQEVRDKAVWDFVVPEDRERVRAIHLSRIAGEEAPSEYEVKGITKSGETRYFRIQASLMEYEGAPATLVTMVDVTDRLKAEQRLRAREAMLQQYMRYTPAAVAMLDTEMRFVAYSRRWITDYRLEDRDITGKSFYEVFPETPERWKEIHRRCLEGSIERSEEDQFPRADGTVDWVRWEIHPWYRSGNQLGGIILFTEVITERKRAADSLAKRSKQLELLSSVSRDLNAELETQTIIRKLITAAMQLVSAEAGACGLLRDGKMVFTEYHRGKEIIPIDLSFTQDCGVPGHVITLRSPYISNDAANDPYVIPEIREKLGFRNLVNVPILNRYGELIGCFELHNKANNADFSETDVGILVGLASNAAIAMENAAMVEAKDKAEANYREIYNSANDAFFIHDAETGQIIDVNARMLEMYGYPLEEALQLTVEDLSAGTPPYTMEDALQWIRKAAAGEPQLFEWLARHKSGKLFWVEVNLKRAVITGQNRLLAIVRDISDRKQTEAKLRESQELFQQFMDNSPAMAFMKDQDGKYLYFNKPLIEGFSTITTEWVGKSDADIMPPEVAREIREHDLEVLSTGSTAEYIETIPLEDGPHHFMVLKFPIIGAEGKTILGGMAVDITARKIAEEALQEAEAKYRSLVEESLVGVYIIQDGVFVYVNPRFAEIFGYEREELLELSPIETITAPGSRDLVRENIRRRIDGEIQSLHYSFQGLKKDGSIIEVEVLGSTTIYKGRVAIIGSLLDVTESRRIEEEKRRLQKEADEAKRRFYRETISAVTEGKLDICDISDIEKIAQEYESFIELNVPSDAPAARKIARDFLNKHGVSGEQMDMWLVCIGEAVTNALKHAGGGIMKLGSTGPNCIWALVSDKGSGMDALALPKATLMSGYSTKPSLGMGYTIILSFADKVLLNTSKDGTSVLIEKNIGEPAISKISLDNMPDMW